MLQWYYYCTRQHKEAMSLEEENRILVKALADCEERLKWANFEMTKARADAERANYLKTSFLANMSHELRTPLNGIVGMTELLLNSDIDEKQRRYAENISSSGDLLLTVLSDIIDFSRIESGEMKLDLTPCNIDKTIKQVVNRYRNVAKEKNLFLEYEFDSVTPTKVIADSTRIGQIVSQLLSNAIKFTKDGGIKVKVECIDKTEHNSVVRFSVSDTGIGVPEDVQETIFDKFSQADISTTRKFGGTGLGLAICRKLVDMMDGKIGLDSVHGDGAIFWFELPLILMESKIEKMIGSYNDIHDLRILLVDDKPVTRNLVREYVESWDMPCDSCDSADHAVSMLEKASEEGNPYNIAIISYEMQGTDGIELGRKIKEKSKIESTILILFSSIKNVDVSELQGIGFADHLEKPVYSSDLFDSLVKVWTMYHSGNESNFAI